MTEKTSDRSRRILRAVVWEYIRSGRPIGSRALAKTTGLNLSPATLRNAMADLEEAGLLQSPHTSGRAAAEHRRHSFFRRFDF